MEIVSHRESGLRRLRDSCESSEECQSGRCFKNECAPVKCRSNNDCLLKAGDDQYCRDRGLMKKIFASECVPKKGSRQKCSSKVECLSNRCLPFIKICT
ncbi:unnamed protein product [Brachionus calyciflorus]|uniref:Uncharacterized protein n=1 Tax=Brachionus calyciflorus TaxID=104777 RepID=A0A814JLT7_9BILA|nr:unnamed protein product [Brachionus calyciflorus]